MSLRSITCALVLIVCGLMACPASAGTILLNNGTFTDTLLLNSGLVIFDPPPPETTLNGIPAAILAIDPTSTATYDTDTGKFTGRLKLLASGESIGGEFSNVILDFTDLGISLGFILPGGGESTSGAEVYNLPIAQIAGNHLTGDGGGIAGTDTEGVVYRLDVTIVDPVVVPLPAAAWQSLIGLGLTGIAVMRFQRGRGRAGL